MIRITSLLVLAASLLAGCASVRQIDSQVQTLSTLKSAPVAGYRFERLPSQQTLDQKNNQAALEAMAEKALALVGLKRDDAQPGYSVLIGARVQRDALALWNDPWYGAGRFSAGFGYGMGRGSRFGSRVGMYWGPGYAPYSTPYYRREVSLLMRDLSTGQVVYETQALHDGPWADNDALLPVMFEAAISGFPTPPAGPRLVNINLLPTVPASPPAAPAGTTTPPAAPAPAK